MNRRNFIRGALALPFAGVGRVERFLVGRYGAPAAMELPALVLPGAYAAAIPLLEKMLGMMEAQVVAQAATIRFQVEALQCGKPS